MLIRKYVCDWCSRSVEVRLKDGSSPSSDPTAEDAALIDGWRPIPHADRVRWRARVFAFAGVES